MTRLAIVEHPDPRLRISAQPVAAFDGALAALIDNLFDTLYSGGGIGLSAPQLGEGQRVFVMDLSDSHCEPQVFVNPQIVAKSGLGMVEESCLSIPGVVGNVFRATQVLVQAQDRNGQRVEQTLSGMHAVCVQHEMDHLAGILFIDRLWLFRRWRMRIAETLAERKSRKLAPFTGDESAGA